MQRIRYTVALEYIGFLTSAYGPVEITFWSLLILIVAEAKEFSLKTRYIIHMLSSIKRSPVTDSQGDMFDQPKR